LEWDRAEWDAIDQQQADSVLAYLQSRFSCSDAAAAVPLLYELHVRFVSEGSPSLWTPIFSDPTLSHLRVLRVYGSLRDETLGWLAQQLPHLHTLELMWSLNYSTPELLASFPQLTSLEIQNTSYPSQRMPPPHSPGSALAQLALQP
jgi:hypothetical protein